MLKFHMKNGDQFKVEKKTMSHLINLPHKIFWGDCVLTKTADGVEVALFPSQIAAVEVLGEKQTGETCMIKLSSGVQFEILRKGVDMFRAHNFRTVGNARIAQVSFQTPTGIVMISTTAVSSILFKEKAKPAAKKG